MEDDRRATEEMAGMATNEVSCRTDTAIENIGNETVVINAYIPPRYPNKDCGRVFRSGDSMYIYSTVNDSTMKTGLNTPIVKLFVEGKEDIKTAGTPLVHCGTKDKAIFSVEGVSHDLVEQGPDVVDIEIGDTWYDKCGVVESFCKENDAYIIMASLNVPEATSCSIRLPDQSTVFGHSVEKCDCSIACLRILVRSKQDLRTINQWKMTGLRANSQITVALLGKSGVGKSCLGNHLLEENIFKTDDSQKSCTLKCSKGERVLPDGLTSLVVMDTPWLFDTEETIASTVKKFVDLFHMLKGVDIFLLLVRNDVKFTKEEMDTLQTIKDVFGEDLHEHAIVILNNHSTKIKNIADVLEDAPAPLTNLISACDDRCVMVNHMTENTPNRDIPHVLAKIKALVSVNNGKQYLHSTYEKTYKEYQVIENEKLQLQQEIKELKKDKRKRERKREKLKLHPEFKDIIGQMDCISSGDESSEEVLDVPNKTTGGNWESTSRDSGNGCNDVNLCLEPDQCKIPTVDVRRIRHNFVNLVQTLHKDIHMLMDHLYSKFVITEGEMNNIDEATKHGKEGEGMRRLLKIIINGGNDAYKKFTDSLEAMRHMQLLEVLRQEIYEDDITATTARMEQELTYSPFKYELPRDQVSTPSIRPQLALVNKPTDYPIIPIIQHQSSIPIPSLTTDQLPDDNSSTPNEYPFTPISENKFIQFDKFEHLVLDQHFFKRDTDQQLTAQQGPQLKSDTEQQLPAQLGLQSKSDTEQQLPAQPDPQLKSETDQQLPAQPGLQFECDADQQLPPGLRQQLKLDTDQKLQHGSGPRLKLRAQPLYGTIDDDTIDYKPGNNFINVHLKYSFNVLDKLGVIDELSAKYILVKFAMKNEGSVLEIKGSSTDLKSVTTDLQSCMEKIQIETIRKLTRNVIQLLINDDLRAFVLEEFFRGERITAAWEADLTDSESIHVYSRDATHLEVITSILFSLVSETTIPVNPESISILTDRAWDVFKEEICKQYKKCVTISVLENGNITITALAKDLQTIQEAVGNFLQNNSFVERNIISHGLGNDRFIMTYYKDNRYLQNVDMIHDKLREILIKGTYTHVKKAASVLEKLQSDIICRRKSLPLCNHDGLEDIILRVEAGAKCVIEIDNPELSTISYFNVKGADVYVSRADITDMDVDVIVCPCNLKLTHFSGVGRAIANKGGAAIAEQCKAQKDRKITIGDCVLTTGGKLLCEKVIHVVAPYWEKDKQTWCRDRLEETIMKALDIFHLYNFTSIAIPNIGAGESMFPAEFSTYAIVNAIKNHTDCVNHSSRKIKIYLVDIQSNTLSFYKRALRKYNVISEPTYVVATSGPGNTGNTTAFGTDSTVRVYRGSITDVVTDVIVNSAPSSLHLSPGGLQTALCKAAGPSLQEECTLNYPTGMKFGDVAVTSPGNLKCKQIYHACLKAYDERKGGERIASLITKCLRMAEKQGYSSIAFPTLGTGVHCYPVKMVADITYKTLENYITQGGQMKYIVLAVLPDDTDIDKEFKSKHQTMLKRQRLAERFTDSSSMLSAHDTDKTNVWFYSDDEQQIQIAMAELESLLSSRLIFYDPYSI